jgi:hypothetical protein
MKIDLHTAVQSLREAYHHYRPHAEKAGLASRLDAAQALLESLTPETLALTPVQGAVAELVPSTDDPAFRYRGRVISFLTVLGVPRSDEVYRGMLEPATAR